MRSRFVMLALCMGSSVAVVGPQQKARVSAELPFELAVSHRTLATERVTLSPDGRWVAYAVQSSLPEGESHVRLLPSGVPALVRGREVLLTNVATGQSRRLGPADSDSWRPSFSPDGARLAFYADDGGSVHLWVHDIAEGASRRVSDAVIKAKLWTGDEPVWNPAATEIFVPVAPQMPSGGPDAGTVPVSHDAPRVTVRRAGSELRPGESSEPAYAPVDPIAENNAHLAAISVSTGRIRIIVPASATPRPSLLQLSPTGAWMSYLPVKGTELSVVPTIGGPARLVTSSLQNDRTVNFGRAAFSWHPSREELFWVQDHRLWRMDLTQPDPKPRQLAEMLTDVTLGPVAFTRDGKTIVVGVRPLDLDDFHNPYPQAIALVPLDGGEPRVIKLPSGVYVRSLVTQQGNTLWQPQDTTVTLVCQETGSAQRLIVRIDLYTNRLQTLWKGFANLELAGASADHALLVGVFEDISTPENVYRFSQDFSKKDRVSDIEPTLTGMSFGPVETFTTAVPRYDGNRGEATTAVLLPVGAKRGDRLPTLVCQYPGMALAHRSLGEFGGGYICGVPLTLFTTRGYAALLVDGSIGPPGTAGNPAAEMTEVVLAQVYRAAELGYTDLTKVAVAGGSAGGYTAAAIVSRTQLFRASIAICGFYDLSGWQEQTTIIHQRMGTHPWGDTQRYLVNSPYYRAADIHTPLLLIHGESDTIPVSEARKLFDALRTLGATAQLATYRGEGHAILKWSRIDSIDVSRRMVEFLDRYLRPAESSTSAANQQSGRN